MLARIAVLELKSVGRPYRIGTLDRLWSYTHTVCADDAELLSRRGDLGAVLAVPCRTRSLDADAQKMGQRADDRGAPFLGGAGWLEGGRDGDS